MPKVAASCSEPSADCQARHSIWEDGYEVFRISLNVRVYISAAGHGVRFGKPKDAFDGLFLMGQLGVLR
jgi:hypothetical protein